MGTPQRFGFCCESGMGRVVNYQAEMASPFSFVSTGGSRWDEKSGLRRDAVRSQVIDALKEPR
jgi:hypothetical protein